MDTTTLSKVAPRVSHANDQMQQAVGVWLASGEARCINKHMESAVRALINVMNTLGYDVQERETNDLVGTR